MFFRIRGEVHKVAMSAHTSIMVGMKVHIDVLALDDEWSGITNQILRRKLQNRLNQRAASG
jgi:hypothetical protein